MEEAMYKCASHLIPCHLFCRKKHIVTASTTSVKMHNYTCVTMSNYLLSLRKGEKPFKKLNVNLY